MRRLTLLLLAATLLALTSPAVSQARNPDEDPHNMTWITPGVFAIGGGGLVPDDLTYLKSQGIGAVADFRNDWDDGAANLTAVGLDYLYLPVDHAMDINLTEINTFLAWAQREAAVHRAIYVHCTDGHHRAAAFAVAWMMMHDQKSYDEASSILMKARPGVEMRDPSALLLYEAQRTQTPALTVFLTSQADAPSPGNAIPVTVEVYARGAPMANANVRLFTEEGGLDMQAVTDANGRATFDYAAPTNGAFMDHLYARAHAPGFTDGMDAMEVYFGTHVPGMGVLSLDAQPQPDGIHVQIGHTRGQLHARVLASTSDGWTWTDSTPNAQLVIPTPPNAGTVTLRVAGWSATSATTTATLTTTGPHPTTVSPQVSPTPSPTAPLHPTTQPVPTSTPRAVDASPFANEAPKKAVPSLEIPGIFAACALAGIITMGRIMRR